MKIIVFVVFTIFTLGCLEKDESNKKQTQDSEMKAFVEETKRLLKKIDNGNSKDPFSITKTGDEVPGKSSKKFSLTPVADATRKLHAYTIRNDLVAWWPFDGDSMDTSGNKRHAKPKNEFSFIDGKIGQAIRIVGVAKSQSFEGGHVMLPYIENLEDGAFTFSLWVREDEVYFGSGHAYIFYGTICNIHHAPAPQWGGHLFDFGEDQSFQKKIVWKDWNLYTVTYDRSTKIGHLNGLEVLREDSASPSTSHWWAKRKNEAGELIYFKPPDSLTELGSKVKPRYSKGALGAHWFYNGHSGATRFVGAFDDVRIYDRALSAGEVQALYNLGQ